MHSFRLLFFALAAALTLWACEPESSDAPPPQGDSVGELAPASERSSQEEAEQPDSSKPVITDTATISTEIGDIVIGLYGKDAPKATENFIGLAKKDYYDGIGFHRIVPGFVIQGGDPQTRDPKLRGDWGTGGESFFGGTFDDELDPNSPSGKIGYVRGTVAMANSGPNTNSSQFFIVLSDAVAQGLPYGYTIFGTVVGGMDVVDGIVARAVDQSGNPVTIPVELVTMKDVTISNAAPSIQ